MMNENAKKINNPAIKVMANTVCLCPVCHKFFSVKNYTEAEIEAVNEHGTCIHCTPVEMHVVPAAPVEKKVSAFKMVRNMVVSANLSDEQIALLTDKTFTQKNAHLAYAMLLPVDETSSYKEQTVKYNKARYSKKTIELNGKAYFLTNDIYKKNVLAVKEMLASL